MTHESRVAITVSLGAIGCLVLLGLVAGLVAIGLFFGAARNRRRTTTPVKPADHNTDRGPTS